MAFRVQPLACGLLLLAACAARAQAPVPAPLPLSLDDCIERALAHNLDVQLARCAPRIAEHALRGAYGAYDPRLSFHAREEFATTPYDFNPAKAGIDYPYDLTTDSFGPALLGRLPCGLTYGFEATAESLDATTFLPAKGRLPASLSLTNAYAGAVSVSLRQPLLRDFWIDAPRLTIQVGHRNLRIAELALRHRVMKTITSVARQYAELAYARAQARAQEQAVELARELLREERRRVAAGAKTPLDAAQAEAQVAGGEAALLVAQQTYAETQTALKGLLSEDLRTWPEMRIEPLEPLAPLPVSYRRSESWARALRLRPDLEGLRLELERQEVQARYRYNQLFPRLDLIGAYGGSGVQPTFGNLARELGHVNGPAYTIGMVLSLPLSNAAARNQYRGAKTAQDHARARLRQLEQTVLAEVEIAGRASQAAADRVRATRQAREFAELALSAEQRKLAAGATTFFFVLRLQRNLTDARAAEARALADCHQALAQLALSEGTTLARHHVELEFR